LGAERFALAAELLALAGVACPLASTCEPTEDGVVWTGAATDCMPAGAGVAAEAAKEDCVAGTIGAVMMVVWVRRREGVVVVVVTMVVVTDVPSVEGEAEKKNEAEKKIFRGGGQRTSCRIQYQL
jgi:hypothetical protein